MNNQVKAVAIVLGVVVLLLGIRFGSSMLNPPNDQVLIKEALAESIEASREGRPGGVMDKLSERFRVNDMEPGTRRQIADFIKNSQPEVVVENDEALVTGDEARIVTPVTIQINWLGQSMNRRLEEVTLVFRKEEATEYLILPTRKWKLAEVIVPDESVQDFMSMG